MSICGGPGPSCVKNIQSVQQTKKAKFDPSCVLKLKGMNKILKNSIISMLVGDNHNVQVFLSLISIIFMVLKC